MGEDSLCREGHGASQGASGARFVTMKYDFASHSHVNGHHNKRGCGVSPRAGETNTRTHKDRLLSHGCLVARRRHDMSFPITWPTSMIVLPIHSSPVSAHRVVFIGPSGTSSSLGALPEGRRGSGDNASGRGVGPSSPSMKGLRGTPPSFADPLGVEPARSETVTLP